MRKIKVVFKEKQHTPVTFESDTVFWDSGTDRIVIKHVVNDGKDTDIDIVGVFEWKDVLYAVSNDCICTAF